MAKHMNVVEVNDDKSKVIMFVIIVLMALFVFGWGENYIAQQNAEERLEKAAQQEEIVSSFQAAMDDFATVQPGRFKYNVSVVDDGVNVRTWAMNGKTVHETSVHYNWTELVEETHAVQAKTMAAQYSM